MTPCMPLHTIQNRRKTRPASPVVTVVTRGFLSQVSSPNEGWNCLEGKILVPTNGDPGIDEYLAWKPPIFFRKPVKFTVANAGGLSMGVWVADQWKNHAKLTNPEKIRAVWWVFFDDESLVGFLEFGTIKELFYQVSESMNERTNE